VGHGVHILPSVKIAVPWNLKVEQYASIGHKAVIYNLGSVTIGERATVSQFAHICAGSHDYRMRSFDLLKPPIYIGCDAWVCAGAFIGPGVTIGSRAIVGACAVVVGDVEPETIVAGNPARYIKKRSPFQD
jgi:putative colanic acid biosynthesis acetyltransferase WcaF